MLASWDMCALLVRYFPQFVVAFMAPFIVSAAVCFVHKFAAEGVSCCQSAPFIGLSVFTLVLLAEHIVVIANCN